MKYPLFVFLCLVAACAVVAVIDSLTSPVGSSQIAQKSTRSFLRMLGGTIDGCLHRPSPVDPREYNS